MIFRDRTHAGELLARTLVERIPDLPGEHPIVLAIPRGGVPVGAEIAAALHAPLDVFVARKLGAPMQEELGIGAVAPDGTRVLDAELIAYLGVSGAYIEDVTRRELAELGRRMMLYRGDVPWPNLAGRAVILVDDGLATGVTARAALAALRRESPARLIFAAPVCSLEGVRRIEAEGTTVVCTATPPAFRGVGEWYDRFDQTTDDEVIALLHSAPAAG